MAMLRLLRPAVIAAALILIATPGFPQLTIYGDALENGWQNVSAGGGTNFDVCCAGAHSGIKKIGYTPAGSDDTVAVARIGQPVTTTKYPLLRFWIKGGTIGLAQLTIRLGSGEPEVIKASASLTPFVDGGWVYYYAWREVDVPLRALNAVPGWDGTFDRITIVTSAGAQPTMFFDDIELRPAPRASPIQFEQNVSVASMMSDRITWSDSVGQIRRASLAHDNIGVFNPDIGAQIYGVAMRELRYQRTNDMTRIASATTSGSGAFGGFGYATARSSVGRTQCAGDEEPLGDLFPLDTYQVIFAGRHHSIARVTQKYRRNCATTGPDSYDLPVTIDWLFATGRDNPLWAITYHVDEARKRSDQSLAPANTFFDDSRAPYGELRINGWSADPGGATAIDGVAWGDRYQFTSTGAGPLTLNSPWSWTGTNTVPYVKAWIDWMAGTGSELRDATMGLVQTQTFAQQDAGGARDPGAGSDIRSLWTKTSTDIGNACANPVYVFPCTVDWPYEAMGKALEAAGGSTTNARMTWKTQYGFIGQTAYDLNDLPGGSTGTAPGYPKKSYSTWIVLGTHTQKPVEAQIAQVESIQNMTLTATTGAVVTSGPAGVDRTDTVTYQPPGYNHVYGALAFNASGNVLVANVDAGPGTIVKPLIIVGNYSGAVPPVMLNDAALIPDVDFFASLRPSNNELWLTINRDFVGPVNNIELFGACAGVPITTPASLPIGATNVVASVPDHAGSSYAWGIDGGTITSGQGTASIQYSAGPAATRITIVVIETNGGACSTTGMTRSLVDFEDVPPTYLFHDFIRKLAVNGVTGGCYAGHYCPSYPVQRQQMAIFLLRGEHGESYVPPVATGTVFADVMASAFAADFIERLYAEGVTGGCASDPLRFCPGANVLRSGMAIFLLRAKHGPAYVPPPAQGIFADVPVGSFAADWIEQLYAEGITGGCAADPLRYCPNDPVTRGQMAAFLSRTFNLQ